MHRVAHKHENRCGKQIFTRLTHMKSAFIKQSQELNSLDMLCFRACFEGYPQYLGIKVCGSWGIVFKRKFA
jgi:hypothetical protein